MANFIDVIKEKLFPKPDFDLEDDEFENPAEGDSSQGDEEEIEDVEVDLGGPEIASAKKNKMLIIAASSLLITVVIYFLFFKDADKPKEKLETVAPIIRARSIAGSEDGKSPFELDLEDKRENSDVSLLEKPKAPEIPELPDIPQEGSEEGLILPQDLFVDVKKEEKKKDAVVSSQENAQQPAPEALPVAAILPVVPTPQAQEQKAPPLTDPRYAPIIVLQGQGDAPALSVGYENNIQVLNGDPIRDLQESQVGVQASFVADRANVVAQGKMITAVLETAINTEAPGSVRGIVSRDVYGEAGSDVLIPRGARLYGSYSTDTARGQARVQINWTRLIRPDGVDLNISSFASDQFGRAGIEGIIDNKYSQLLTNSVLTSAFAVAGAAIADSLIGNDNNQQTATVDPNNGTSTITSTATTQAVTDVTRNITGIASQFTNEFFDARPTITVPQGTRITVLVNADIKMPPVRR